MLNNERIHCPIVGTEKEIIDLYYEAVAASVCDDYLPMQLFKEQYPQQYRHYCAVHRKRSILHLCYDAMEATNQKVYFGTLTYNNEKNENKITSKRKEAFTKLNTLFEYLCLVEEYGEDNGRYHIHFFGVFRVGQSFDSFIAVWNHSRQNLREIQDGKKVAKYLCKYLSKDLPRIRRNKKLVALCREYHKGKSLQRFFPTVKDFDPVGLARNYHFISALDDV